MSSDSDRKGAPPALKTVIAAAPSRAARDRGVVTVTGGNDAGKVISLPPGNMLALGRADEADVRFDDVSLSRIHARVVRIGSEYVINDAGSTNGTYINDRRIDAPTSLKDGDRIQLGSNTTLRFSLVDLAEEQALRQVYEAAMKDGLTGIANRKHLEERLDAEVGYAIRHGSPLSIVMLDVDHFKRVNDPLGHLAGDAVLRHMGAALSAGLRQEDLVARYGGEEFVIVARGIEVMNALHVADRLRIWISQTPVYFENQQIWITSSAGVASLADCGDKKDKASLLAAADGRLYQAKHGGRNRVVGPTG